MQFSFFKKIYILFVALGTVYRRPISHFFIDLIKPIDAPRYLEFTYLIDFFKKNSLSSMKILDVSSPHAIDYILSKNNTVLKINYDEREKSYIRQSDKLKFKKEDATAMTFSDNQYDFTISISVIEHIYQQYIKAIQEMIRVTRSGGYIYLTFPVAKKHTEEWNADNIYLNQHGEKSDYFFQYRFDQGDVNEILYSVTSCEVVMSDIFWERTADLYDLMISQLKNRNMNKFFRLVRIPFIHLWYGFTLFKSKSEDFSNATSCGNMHIILRKK